MPQTKYEKMFYGRTFGDFLIKPRMGRVQSRRQIDLAMPLTHQIKLNMPVIGANMDTVMGKSMMQALSMEGAFGFLHRNCSIDEQARMVREVKRLHAFVVESPLILHRKVKLGQAKKLMDEQGISGILVEESPGSNVLAGIVSHRDIPMDIKDLRDGMNADEKAIDKFMTPFAQLVCAGPGIGIEDAERLMFEHRIEKLPIIDEQRQIVGLVTRRDLRLAKKKPHSLKDKKGRLLVGASVGASGDFMERAEALVEAGCDAILIDVAHAHSVVVQNAVKEFRRKFKKINLVCGNVATADGAKFLMELGADAIKIGIGPGRGCRTRLETAIGVPQMQAIHEAYVGVGGKIPIIADGGITEDKDIALAISAGASTVMLGSKLAGTDQAPGRIIIDPKTKQKLKSYRGMTSPQAVLENTAVSDMDDALATPSEGQSLDVPYRGSVVDLLADMKGHLQSFVSYVGEDSLAVAQKKIIADPESYLIQISEASKKESFER